MQHNSARAHAYRELVLLRGETVTLLEERRVSVGEARWLDQRLDRARTELDRGRVQDARIRLSAARAYLRGREGPWTH